MKARSARTALRRNGRAFHAQVTASLSLQATSRFSIPNLPQGWQPQLSDGQRGSWSIRQQGARVSIRVISRLRAVRELLSWGNHRFGGGGEADDGFLGDIR